MSWLSRVLHGPTPTAIPPEPPISAQEKYARSLATLQAAREELATASEAVHNYLRLHPDIRYVRYANRGVSVKIGAMNLMPALSSLESRQRALTKKFWEAQSYSAACKKAAGQSSY